MNKMSGLTRIVLPLVIFLTWLLSTQLRFVDPYLLPSPGEVAKTGWDMALSGELFTHLGASLGRVVVGFVIASFVGIPLGFALGMSAKLARTLEPVVRFLRQVPPVAWIPLFILWFGIGEGSKQAVIIYATIFPILVNTSLGVISVDNALLEVGRAYCMKPSEVLRKIVVPSAIPSVFAGLRLGLGQSWRALVAAEMVAAASGIGYLIMESRSMAQPQGVLVGIISIGLVGTAMDALMISLETRLTPWKMTKREDTGLG